MQVVATHTVKDPVAFFAAIPAVAQNSPPGVHPLIAAPSADRSRAVCLWQADSLQSVQEYLDAVSEGLSENSYFVVDEAVAIGLPHAAAPSTDHR